MIEILTLGFLVGLGHALEADHLAAVSTLVSREQAVSRMIRHGLSWGIGHALTLFLIAGAAVSLRLTLDERLAGGLELVVGLILVGLGSRVIWRLLQDRVHIHRHRHANGRIHLHAHSHRSEISPHDAGAHSHPHPRGIDAGSFSIGLLHGMAGSASLVVLAASALATPAAALGYIMLFGLGSIIGMGLLSTVIAVPLSWSARTLTALHRSLQAGIGVMAIIIGSLSLMGLLPDFLLA